MDSLCSTARAVAESGAVQTASPFLSRAISSTSRRLRSSSTMSMLAMSFLC